MILTVFFLRASDRDSEILNIRIINGMYNNELISPAYILGYISVLKLFEAVSCIFYLIKGCQVPGNL